MKKICIKENILFEFFTHWAKLSGVMDEYGMTWLQCYPELDTLNKGEDDGSIDWNGNFSGECPYHNDGDW